VWVGGPGRARRSTRADFIGHFRAHQDHVLPALMIVESVPDGGAEEDAAAPRRFVFVQFDQKNADLREPIGGVRTEDGGLGAFDVDLEDINVLLSGLGQELPDAVAFHGIRAIFIG
jgi:hypothetical protein